MSTAILDRGLVVDDGRLQYAWFKVQAEQSTRYHAVALPTPRQVHHALTYVLDNWRRHGQPDSPPGGRRVGYPRSSVHSSC